MVCMIACDEACLLAMAAILVVWVEHNTMGAPVANQAMATR